MKKKIILFSLSIVMPLASVLAEWEPEGLRVGTRSETVPMPVVEKPVSGASETDRTWDLEKNKQAITAPTGGDDKEEASSIQKDAYLKIDDIDGKSTVIPTFMCPDGTQVSRPSDCPAEEPDDAPKIDRGTPELMLSGATGNRKRHLPKTDGSTPDLNLHCANGKCINKEGGPLERPEPMKMGTKKAVSYGSTRSNRNGINKEEDDNDCDGGDCDKALKTGGRTGGRADFQNFTITKEGRNPQTGKDNSIGSKIDRGTPDLNLHCANGKCDKDGDSSANEQDSDVDEKGLNRKECLDGSIVSEGTPCPPVKVEREKINNHTTQSNQTSGMSTPSRGDGGKRRPYATKKDADIKAMAEELVNLSIKEDDDCDGDTCGEVKANHNTTRSNQTQGIAVDGKFKY